MRQLRQLGQTGGVVIGSGDGVVADEARWTLGIGVQHGCGIAHALRGLGPHAPQLAATHPPGEVVDLLNEFFNVVVETVREYGGFVNKFLGDAALCIFGAPLEHPDAAGAALAAARKLHDALVGVLGQTEFGIGVSAGRAIAGHIGAQARFEYTVIGDPVNEAARLTELAKLEHDHVLASAIAVSGALDAEALCWKVGEIVELRGRTAPTQLARPVNLVQPQDLSESAGVILS
jgi:adenylate cyclase